MSLRRGARFVCDTCLAQLRRRASHPTITSAAAAAKGSTLRTTSRRPLIRHSSTWSSPLRSRRLIAVHGHDAATFLQGLTTANIPTSGLLSSPSNPQAIYSAFMNAQGRLLNDVFIYPIHPQHALRRIIAGTADSGSHPAFAIEVDAEQTAKLQAVLKKYKLRAKVTIRTIEEEELGVFALWGTGDARPTKSSSSRDASSSEYFLTSDPRTPRPWHRLVARPEDATDALAAMDASEASETAYKIQRYLYGVPEGQVELPREETLLHEANIDLMHGVDFRKGCYVGQELVIRTQHTGVVRKRVMPVQIWVDEAAATQAQGQTEAEYQGSSTDPTHSPLAFLQNQNFKTRGSKRPDGKLLGTVGNLGLALCRLERVVEAEDAVAKGPTKSLHLDLSSYTGSGASDAWIKPFVPSWWLERGQIMEGGYESLKVRAIGSKS